MHGNAWTTQQAAACVPARPASRSLRHAARPAAGQAPTTPRLEKHGRRPAGRHGVLVNLRRRRASRSVVPFGTVRPSHMGWDGMGAFLGVGAFLQTSSVVLCGSPWSQKSQHPVSKKIATSWSIESSIPERVSWVVAVISVLVLAFGSVTAPGPKFLVQRELSCWIPITNPPLISLFLVSLF